MMTCASGADSLTARQGSFEVASPRFPVPNPRIASPDVAHLESAEGGSYVTGRQSPVPWQVSRSRVSIPIHESRIPSPSYADPVTTRHISLDTIREAAPAVYRAAVRTPLVRLELPRTAPGPEVFLKLETLQPIGSFKIRGAQNAVSRLTADRVVGRDLDRQCRKRRTRRGARGTARRRALQRHGDGYRAGDQTARDRAARRRDRHRLVRRMLAHGRTTRLRPDGAARSCIRSTTTGSFRATGPSGSRLSRICPTSTPSSHRSAAAASWRALAARCIRFDPPRVSTPRSRPQQHRWPSPCARGDPGASMPGRRRSSMVQAGVRCCRRCGRSSARGCTSRWSCRSTRRRGPCARWQTGRTSSSRARRRARSPRCCHQTFAQRGHQRVVAVVSGGNIDLARFAELAGACR